MNFRSHTVMTLYPSNGKSEALAAFDLKLVERVGHAGSADATCHVPMIPTGSPKKSAADTGELCSAEAATRRTVGAGRVL